MPAWFRRGWARLLHPAQCVQCGDRIDDDEGFRRRPFEVFCCEPCEWMWDRNRDAPEG